MIDHGTDAPHSRHSGSWREDGVLSRIDPASFDLLSLDIFDTLLMRACHAPTDVFRLMGEQGIGAGLIDPDIPPSLFVRLRVEMEGRARRRKKDRDGTVEVTLAEIYREGPPHLGDPERLMALELAVESQVLFANPRVLALADDARAAGRTVCLTSDMYLDAAQVSRLLAGAGIAPERFDGILMSCETGASKHVGDLFAEVRRRWPDRRRILHLGDNYIADFFRPTSLGLRAVLYQPGDLTLQTDYREAMMASPSRPSVLSALRRLGRLANRHDGHDDPRDAFFHDFGAAILGPAVVEFCRWVVEDCRAKGVRTILPIMREGQIFARVMRQCVEQAGGIEQAGGGIAVMPLYASRRSTFLAGLDALDAEALDSFFTRRTYTVRDLLEELAIGSLLEPTFAAALDTPLMDAAARPGPEDGTLKEALADHLLRRPEVQAAIDRTIQDCRGRLNDYVAGLCPDHDAVATVDLGAGGSTQHSLIRSLARGDRPAPQIHAYLLYAAQAVVARSVEGSRFHVFFGWDAAALEKMRVIYRSPEIFEQFLVGTEATTLGYARQPGGAVVPVTDDYRLGAAQRRAIAACHDGLETWWRQTLIVADRRRPADPADPAPADPFAIPPADLLDILHRCVEFPSRQEAEFLGALRFDDNFGSSGIRTICDPATVEAARAAPPETFYRRYRMGEVGGQTIPWPQGCLTLAHPDFLFHQHHFHAARSHQDIVAAEIIRRLSADKVSRLLVYGAGEIGRQLLSLLAGLSFQCVGVIDRNQALHGLDLFKAPVVSLADSLSLDCDTIAVASVAFKDEIVRDIEAAWRATGRTPRIIGAT